MKLAARAQTLTMCCILCSGTHAGAAGAFGEVPGGIKEAEPARGGTCAADGHLPAVSRYCRSGFMWEEPTMSHRMLEMTHFGFTTYVLWTYQNKYLKIQVEDLFFSWAYVCIMYV